MKKLIILIPLFFSFLLSAKTEFESYNWETFPANDHSDTVKCVNGAAITLERRIFETYVNSENNFEEMYVYHQKIKIDSHDALTRFNKIYISLQNVIEVIDIQARFVSPAGKITILPRESIKQIANMDNEGDHKTFAIEGAEIGGQIEYFYVLRKNYDPYSGFYVQGITPKHNVEILFAYPSKIAYLVKTYNGLPPFKADLNNPDKTYQKTFIAYISPIEEEKYSYYEANLMRFEYTLAYNNYNSVLRKYSWATGSANTHKNIYALSKGDQSAAAALYKKIAPEKGGTEVKVRAIENWIKSGFSISKDIPASKELSETIKLKQANPFAAVKLFVALLRAGNIEFEFVETGDNISRPFDPDFNCINFLNNYLIYFPDIDRYLIPDDTEYRLGLIPARFQGAYGLFLRPVNYNENTEILVYEVRKIPVSDHISNTDSLVIDLALDDNLTDVHAEIKRSISGELGRVFQNVLYRLPDDKKKEVTRQVFLTGSQHARIDSLILKNCNPDEIGRLPLNWNVSIKSDELVENAGGDLLFHIGETIGKQSELYQEKSRKLPINVGILHNYFRKIVFHIPQGYTVANPENMEMNVVMKNGDRIGCTFTSQAKIEGNQLVITSHEYYTDESYASDRYNEFREVINAAADFNKRNILIKKL